MIAGGIALGAMVGGYMGRKQIASAWVPTSNEQLVNAELKMYEPLDFPVEHYMIPSAATSSVPAGAKYYIHTIRVGHRPHGNTTKPTSPASTANTTTTTTSNDIKSSSSSSSSTAAAATVSSVPVIGRRSTLTGRPPMVLLHGLGGGAALWSMNLDALSREYEIIAIDLLGFGRSTRMTYTGRTADDAIAYWIDSLEHWRQYLGIESMVLVGHSLGSYVATNYAIRYPSRVHRLVVVCPFGIIHSTSLSGEHRDLPFYWKIGLKVITATSPQTFVRLLGHAGPSLMYRFRGNYDNGRYTRLYGAGDTRVSEYVYHLTAGASGSGDYAFMALINEQRYVTRPLSDRLSKLSMPVTAIYGELDPIVVHTGDLLKAEVPNVEVFTIGRSAHQCYASHSDQFHTAILHHINNTSSLHVGDTPPSSNVVPPPTKPPADPLDTALEL